MKLKILIVVVSIGLLVGGIVYFECFECADDEQTFDLSNLDGEWDCVSAWSGDNEGVPIPYSSRTRVTCVENVLSGTGVVYLGDARWDEVIEGDCYVSDRDLYGARTSTVTVPKNEAAQQFERERLGGESLSSVADEVHRDYRIRVTAVSETQFQGADQEGHPITCIRP